MILAFFRMFPLGGRGGPEKDQGCGTALSRDLSSSIIPLSVTSGGIPGHGSDFMGCGTGWLGQYFSYWVWSSPVVKILALGSGQS